MGEPLLAGAEKITASDWFCDVMEEMTGAAGADGVVNEVVAAAPAPLPLTASSSRVTVVPLPSPVNDRGLAVDVGVQLLPPLVLY